MAFRSKGFLRSALLTLLILLALCGSVSAGRRRNGGGGQRVVGAPTTPHQNSVATPTDTGTSGLAADPVQASDTGQHGPGNTQSQPTTAPPEPGGLNAIPPAAVPGRKSGNRRRGSGRGPPPPCPPLDAAPADFIAGGHVPGVPSVVPAPTEAPLPGEKNRDAEQRERIRDLLSCELAVNQLSRDQLSVCCSISAAYNHPDQRAAESRIRKTYQVIDDSLSRVAAELQELRRFLARERAGRNLPPALPFAEDAIGEFVYQDAAAASSTGPALLPSPLDVVTPRCLQYHTPIWDALIWRAVCRMDPSGCSQEANMLRNYPPYLHRHSEPLEPTAPQSTPSLTTGAPTSLSPHEPAVAAEFAPPPSTEHEHVFGEQISACDALPGVDGDVGGSAVAEGKCDSGSEWEGEGEGSETSALDDYELYASGFFSDGGGDSDLYEDEDDVSDEGW